MTQTDSIVDEIRGIETKVDSLEKKVDRMLFYLESDSNTNQQGIVEKTEINARNIARIEEKIKIYEAKASFLGLIGGAVFYIVTWLLKALTSQ
jgi:cob(I)alamin adenosyltransferase